MAHVFCASFSSQSVHSATSQTSSQGTIIGVKGAFQNVSSNMLPDLPSGAKAMNELAPDWADPESWSEIPGSMRVSLDHVKVCNPGPMFTQLLPDYPRHQILVCALAGISPAVLDHLRNLGKAAAERAGYAFEDLTLTRSHYSWPKAKFISNSDKSVYYLKNFQPFMALIRPLTYAATYGADKNGKHLMMFKSFAHCREAHELFTALRINTKGAIPSAADDVNDRNAATARAQAAAAAAGNGAPA